KHYNGGLDSAKPSVFLYYGNLDATRNEGNGKSLMMKWRKPAWSGPKSINEHFSLELSRSWAFLDKSRA
ncbi:hypothetical protein LINPERHAP2_LOCUS14883, partial [Linum perenne]